VTVDVAGRDATEQPIYKRIQEYIKEKYGFKVHIAYITEVKQTSEINVHKIPNAVEQKEYEPRPCPAKSEGYFLLFVVCSQYSKRSKCFIRK